MPSKTGMDRIQVYEQPERLASVVLTHYNAQTGLGFKIHTINSLWDRCLYICSKLPQETIELVA